MQWLVEASSRVEVGPRRGICDLWYFLGRKIPRRGIFSRGIFDINRGTRGIPIPQILNVRGIFQKKSSNVVSILA